MTCPLYEFCKFARKDYQCTRSYDTCGTKRRLETWIKEIIEGVK